MLLYVKLNFKIFLFPFFNFLLSSEHSYFCIFNKIRILKIEDLLQYYQQDNRTQTISNHLKNIEKNRIQLKGVLGSASSLFAASVFKETSLIQIVVLSDKETAAYFYNDIENLFDEQDKVFYKKKVLFFPTSYKRAYEIDKVDSTNQLLRTEVLKRLGSKARNTMIVTFPEALSEKVITKKFLKDNTLKLKTGEKVSFDFIVEVLYEYDFEQTDFVVEPGQFAVRGGIIDVFSFSNDNPYRIEFFDEEVESIRSFDPVSQLSIDKLAHITIIPNVQNRMLREKRESFFSYIPNSSVLWFEDIVFTADKIVSEYEKAEKAYTELNTETEHFSPKELFITKDDFIESIPEFSIIEFGRKYFFTDAEVFKFNISPQPSFNKNFQLLLENFDKNSADNIKNLFLSDNPKQIERIYAIFEDIQSRNNNPETINFIPLMVAMHEGFIDNDLKIACYTDHQIFERYYKFRLKDSFKSKEAFTLKEIYNLTPGDYVTHIDYGIGRFDGLEKIENNGKLQEAIRLIYKDNDILYISIHSLHRISKYIGKESSTPKLNKLGTSAWKNLKARTKNKIKDIAKELIKLYAERKSSKGFQFSPDTYLQHELEASFIYEDTPDQLKSTVNVKKDLEAENPMDRLICGDVGFGKTEIAIRAAFKAVTDSKQVAILVPTTILALQHYRTFSERLEGFPCNIDYINRFKSAKKQTETLKKLETGTLDIIIGTHRLVSKDVKFKDLGLLIIDEEQKFGVAMKEKLKKIKINVDTLTLSATPIPRTLQFSLMGARDLSIINTAPPNRYPIQTELHSFNEAIIKDAINYEVSRLGQVFFLHNRVQNIYVVAEMIQRICPHVRVAIGHGQLKGEKLEKIMLGFIDGEYDVLVATTIIESGLDIPNANTIIINDAQNHGLSDLHQLRGRVGRTNKKAFCYLLAPPLSVLTPDARKRLKAIEEFSELGSGFNIAMRDLDIRGAGNILGGEQSGFISDVGFEMYHKIIDEAILELKENEFKDVFKDEISKEFVKDCLIETDLEILLPDYYISNITERLSLYKELDHIENEDALFAFQEKLIDRFGTPPKETQELFNTIRLRWIAKEIGFEKIVLKQNKLIGYFISNQESPYFQSTNFSLVLNFLKVNPKLCRMREHNNKLSLTFINISGVGDGIKVLESIIR